MSCLVHQCSSNVLLAIPSVPSWLAHAAGCIMFPHVDPETRPVPLATADLETSNLAPEQPSTAATTLSDTEAIIKAEATADTEGGKPRAVQGLKELLSGPSLAKQLDCSGKHFASFTVPTLGSDHCALWFTRGLYALQMSWMRGHCYRSQMRRLQLMARLRKAWTRPLPPQSSRCRTPGTLCCELAGNGLGVHAWQEAGCLAPVVGMGRQLVGCCFALMPTSSGPGVWQKAAHALWMMLMSMSKEAPGQGCPRACMTWSWSARRVRETGLQ